MKVNSFLRISTLSVVLLGCGLLWEYRENHEIKDWTWAADDVQTFEYTTYETQVLDATVLIRHLHGFQYRSIALKCEVTTPDTSLVVSFVIPIRDDQGDYLGEGSVDLWDVSYRFMAGHTFVPGEYSFRISQETANPLPLLMEVGLQLEQSEH
ncbi:MAG: hypothetical protein HQ500_12720 [Flavobacteriales bacterium]|nr:hypothetical protein [Flavobacteriales bacterium]